MHPSREIKGKYKVPVEQPGEKSLSRKVDVEENWHEDIGELLFEEVDLEAEKKTLQVLTGVKKRKISATLHKDVQNWEDVSGPGDSVANVQEATFDKTQRVNAETQTDTVVKEVKPGKNRRKIIRVIKRF
uniref:Uncharacterized protein n=1 Tax=Magallana gigas TaxID=29159 RepID=K1RKH9_MAGGI